jgi:acyl carrier protein
LTEAAIYEFLTEVLREVFQRDDIVANAELTARDIAGWDSFKQIEIIIATEQRFSIKLSTKELDCLFCVGDLVRAVTSRLGQGSSAPSGLL